MSTSSIRALIVVALLCLIVGLIGINVYGPPSGKTLAVEEAGLIGAIISMLSLVGGYYFPRG